MKSARLFLRDLGRILGTAPGQIWGIYCLTMMFLVFTLIWPSEILTAKTPFKIVSGPVRAGEYITWEIDYCKSLPLSADVVVQVVNSHGTTIKEFSGNVPTGCNKYRDFAIMPPAMPEGWYHLRWIAKYHPWPWITKEYVFTSEWFEVVEG